MHKRLTALLLGLCLLLSVALPADAAEEERDQPLRYTIVNTEGFLTFAEKCRVDRFSQNLEVVLAADIDLTGRDFSGIPIFCGSFLGNGHTIRGLSILEAGSNQGLFRFLTETALVQDLKVIGNVQPEGSRSMVGGIAGSNAGKILNCSFTGQVSGGDSVGGIAGKTELSGLIEGCTVSGQIYGTHFVGGITGKNNGVIRSCENQANINDSAQQNTVSLSDITIASLTGSESAGTVTDVGGIAGSSIGVIRECVNAGNVGYQQMGYNIGGIAGTQSGSILDCQNHGQIHGRKDVGGIVGQQEPTALISFEEDAIQILQRQLNTMGGTVSATVSNVQGTGDKIATQVGNLKDYVTDAQDAVESLVPTPENPELPDRDALQAAQNTISSSISGMTETLKGMQESTYSSIGALSNNLHSLQNQMNAMRSTLGNISQTLGGSITDVSDRDTEEDLTGKISGCTNFGEILADRNAGGIAGTIGLENDLDMEEDWSILGENSLNFESELRAVVLECTNHASITCKKQKGGGIVGWQSLGLVKDCLNVGDLEAKGADYAGGIAGQSLGYIRDCFAKGRIVAGEYVGGIAGSGRVVTNCRSITEVSEASEHLGAVLGDVYDALETEETPISGNFYFSPANDPGGVDGISYTGQAEGLDRTTFLELEDLPDSFREVSVRFQYPDGTELRVAVPLGESLSQSSVPALPEKNGYEVSWQGLTEQALGSVLFDVTYEILYTAKKTVLQAGSGNMPPKLLVQGLFTEDGSLQLSQWQESVPLDDGQTLVEAWELAISGSEEVTGLRLRLPEGSEAKNVRLWIRSKDGTWRQELTTADGSYLAAPMSENDCAVALVQIPTYWKLYVVAASGCVFLLLAGFLTRRKEKQTG